MEMSTRRKVWIGIFITLTLLMIPVSVRMIKFAYSFSSGGHAMNLLESGASEVFVKEQAPRVGFISSFFYFFGVPFPGYLLVNLVLIYFLGIQIGSRQIPFWKTSAAICFIAGIAFSLSFIAWDKRPFFNVLVGSVTLWLAIFVLMSALVGCGNLAMKLFRRAPQKMGSV